MVAVLDRWRAMIVALCLAVGGCNNGCNNDTVQKPGSDSTPPAIRWHVDNLTSGATVDLGAHVSYRAGKDDELRVTVHINDPEGVHIVSLNLNATTSCAGDDVASTSNASTYTNTVTLTPDAQNRVVTHWFLMANSEADKTCPTGLSWVGTTVGAAGGGDNYYGGMSRTHWASPRSARRVSASIALMRAEHPSRGAA